MPQTWTIEAMLAKLVAFPTISSDSNLPLIDFVENWLAEQGVTATRVPDATGQKAALFARIGPNVPGGVVLSAHTDVVPVKGQDWSSDPFELTERDGRYYGRGTCDMKGFAAVALAMVPRMMAAPLTRPIDIALSYDEEIGCRGAPPMIAALRAAHPPGAITLVGEPTSMKVVTGHKAVAELDVQVHGYEVHSSLLPTGVSAIMYAAELIHWLNLQNAANATAALKLSAEDPAAAFEPPYTTLHSGVIEGGTAHNITARLCRLTIEIRSVPGDTLTARIAALKAEAARLTAEMQAIHPETGFTINVGSAVPGCAPEVDGAAEALARRLTGDNGQHVVAYGTEAGQFQEGGYSTVVCGPGSIDQAHQRDEWVAKDQLLACEQMIGKLITALSD